MNDSNDDVLDRVLRAVEENDAAAIALIYADGIRIWHAHDGVAKGKAHGISALGGLHVLGTPRYHVLERIHFGDRIAQRHQLVITAHEGGERYTLNAALFLTIEDGRITAFDEYMDSGQLGVIGAAIGRAAKARGAAG